MNSRERTLAIILVVVMVCALGGFVGYQFVLTPLQLANKQERTLRDEVDELEAKKRTVEEQQTEFETKTRKKGLPADVTQSQREYERMLDRMLRKSGFSSIPVITPKPPDTRAPNVANKRPAYTKLDFDVSIKGDELALVEFLHHFYRQPLLHQIRKISILKPSARTTSRDLDVTMTIEALVVDRAENRPTLIATLPFIVLASGGAGSAGFSMKNVESGFGTPFTAAGVLARNNNIPYTPAGILARHDNPFSVAGAQSEYRKIAGKDIFFGPMPVVYSQPAEKEPVLDSYLFLTRFSHSNGRASAMIFDRLNKQEYEIEQDASGKVSVSKFWFFRHEANDGVSEIRKQVSPDDYDPRFLEFGTEAGGNYRVYMVRRILEHDLLLETYDADRLRLMKGPAPAAVGGMVNLALPGKFYLWGVGQFLATESKSMSMRELTDKSETRAALLRPLNLDNPVTETEPPEQVPKKFKRPPR